MDKKYSEINKELAKGVQELKENLSQNKEYLNYHEENKIIMQEHINELNNEIYALNNENNKSLKTLKEEFEKSKLKDSELNEYLKKIQCNKNYKILIIK